MLTNNNKSVMWQLKNNIRHGTNGGCFPIYTSRSELLSEESLWASCLHEFPCVCSFCLFFFFFLLYLHVPPARVRAFVRALGKVSRPEMEVWYRNRWEEGGEEGWHTNNACHRDGEEERRGEEWGGGDLGGNYRKDIMFPRALPGNLEKIWEGFKMGCNV